MGILISEYAVSIYGWDHPAHGLHIYSFWIYGIDIWLQIKENLYVFIEGESSEGERERERKRETVIKYIEKNYADYCCFCGDEV